MPSENANSQTLTAILNRRSVTAKDLTEPGPSNTEINDLLKAAHRVPDHKKLGPWRFVLLTGENRAIFGEQVSDILSKSLETTPQAIAFERVRFLQAPVVIVVISSPVEHPKAPQWEQVLSAGAACQNILLAATAMGYGSQWLSEWYSYDKNVHSLLGMRSDENVAGFIYVGSYEKTPKERERPDLDSRVAYWQGNN